MPKEIQSNALRGEYMRGIVDKTINEIHDDLVTVFGPFATDAYLTKNGEPYYTRDGKETAVSLRFDNELSTYILKIIYQAIHQQGTKVGDGTTTLAVLYTNLYKAMRRYIEQFSRNTWNRAIAELNKRITARSVPMDDSNLRSMLLTCTQEVDLSAKIYSQLRDPILQQAFIMINKANTDTDFQITVHNSPVIKATRQFSVMPVKDHENNAVILYCKGMLDITQPDVLLTIMSQVLLVNNNPTPVTYILLCHGLTESTRRVTKELISKLRATGLTDAQLADYNNIAIYTLTEYRGYTADQFEDISTILTDEVGVGELVNQLTFESLLYQALKTGGATIPDIPELNTYDCDTHNIDKLRSLMLAPYPLDFDEVDGIRLHKKFGPVAQARYDELREEIANEKSAVRIQSLNRRLRTMYGQFIEVEVGSKLIKDSQRKYELILDAILSSSEGVQHGVLPANSLLIAYQETLKLLEETDLDDSAKTVYDILAYAIMHTICDMIGNGWDAPFVSSDGEVDHDKFRDWVMNGNIDRFDLKKDYWDEVLPRTTVPSPELSMLFEPADMKTVTTSDGEKFTFPDQIVEPVTIITTMLENSTTILELVNAKTFHLNGFMQNYL